MESIITVTVTALFVSMVWLVVMLVREHRTKSNYARFMGELFRLQNKWSMRGEVEYAKGIGLLIESFAPKVEDEPLTEYGRTLKKDLTNG